MYQSNINHIFFFLTGDLFSMLSNCLKQFKQYTTCKNKNKNNQ